MNSTRTRTLFGSLVVGVLVAGSALGLAAPAQAHNYPVASTPDEGSTITELPDRFSITTNAPLLDLSGNGNGFALQVVDAEGQYYGDGCVTVEGSSVYTIAALGEAGDYRMLWQVVSEDAHSVSGEVAFTWNPSDPAQQSEGSATPPACAAAGEEPVPEVETPAAYVDNSDALWIGGAIVAVLVAALVTFLVLRRGTKTQEKSE